MQTDCYYAARQKFSCNVQRALHVLGEKWILYILREFIYDNNKQTFGELLKKLKPISSRTLSLKLKVLQQRGLITRKIVNEQPVRVEYTITKEGLALKPTLVCFGDWFIENFNKESTHK